MIFSDLERICAPTMHNFLKYYFFPKGTCFRFQVWLRLMQGVKLHKVLKVVLGPAVYLGFRHYEYKYGIHCNTNIRIGKGLQIVHGGSVYLNCEGIGDNFTVDQNVTLGKIPGGGIPLVRDNVTVYTGSVVVGSVILKDNATIGALSYVDKNVETGETVVGIPARMIRKQ